MSIGFTHLSEYFPGETPLPPKQRMSEEEFVAWALRTHTNAEWIDGEVVYVSPQNREHGSLQLWLMRLLSEYAEANDLGTVCFEMLLRLSGGRRLRVPDIFFVRKGRESIIGETMVCEPPDLAIEIVSADSAARDWREKYLEYEDFGIREYWVIDPHLESVAAYTLDGQAKYQVIAIAEGKLYSRELPGLWLNTQWLSPSHRPPVSEVLRQWRLR